MFETLESDQPIAALDDNHLHKLRRQNQFRSAMVTNQILCLRLQNPKRIEPASPRRPCSKRIPNLIIAAKTTTRISASNSATERASYPSGSFQPPAQNAPDTAHNSWQWSNVQSLGTRDHQREPRSGTGTAIPRSLPRFDIPSKPSGFFVSMVAGRGSVNVKVYVKGQGSASANAILRDTVYGAIETLVLTNPSGITGVNITDPQSNNSLETSVLATESAVVVCRYLEGT